MIRWFTTILIFFTLCVVVTTTAYADTYNFFFDEKDKIKKKKSVPPPPPPPQPQKPIIKAEPNRQVIRVPGLKAPIVINNTNNVGTAGQNSNMQTTGPKTQSLEPIPNIVAPGPEVAFEYAPPQSSPTQWASPWRLELTALFMSEEYLSAESNYGEISNHEVWGTSWGGVVGLGYHFSRAIAMSLYGGMRAQAPGEREKFFGGVDLELYPLRIPITKWGFDLVQLGLMVGGSTVMAAAGEIGTLHAGARLNINVLKQLGLTAAARANFGHVMFSFGLITRI